MSGEAFSQKDAFTFAPTGEENRDAAWWTDFGLILYEHRGGGNFRARTYGPNGAGFEEDLEITVVRPIDRENRGTWTVTGWSKTPDGTEIEIRETFTLEGTQLSMVTEQRPRRDATAKYIVIAEANYERAGRR
jgi:hypothetical protein